MGARDSYNAGTFCWVDHLSPDASAAKRFYGALLGWEWPAGDGYVHFSLGGQDVAGVYELEGAAARWTSYVAVADADAAAARAGELGGVVVEAPFDIGDDGRRVVVADPVGAHVALWQARAQAGAELVNDLGCWCSNQLVAPEPEPAIAFYRELFGWEIEAAGDGYWSVLNAGADNGGILASPATAELARLLPRRGCRRCGAQRRIGRRERPVRAGDDRPRPDRRARRPAGRRVRPVRGRDRPVTQRLERRSRTDFVSFSPLGSRSSSVTRFERPRLIALRPRLFSRSVFKTLRPARHRQRRAGEPLALLAEHGDASVTGRRDIAEQRVHLEEALAVGLQRQVEQQGRPRVRPAGSGSSAEAGSLAGGFGVTVGGGTVTGGFGAAAVLNVL